MGIHGMAYKISGAENEAESDEESGAQCTILSVIFALLASLY